MTQALVSSMDLAKASRGSKAEPQAATWGLPWLERRLPAPMPGSLTIVGAGTNVGKTYAALMLARGQAEHGPAVVYSLEDPPKEIGRRLDVGLAHPNLYVVFPERNHLSEILASIESLFAGSGPKPRFVWVDYLQLIAYDADIQAWSKADAVSRTTAELKACFKRVGVPGGVLSQLRRVGPEEAGSFPTIHLLKESGDIENMAEVILLLGGKPRSEFVTMEISKAKNAPVGDRCRFRRGAGGVLVPVDERAEEDGHDRF